jgi:hypothetical protein
VSAEREVHVAKPCAWCGRAIDDDERICPGCLSAQPTAGRGLTASAPMVGAPANWSGPAPGAPADARGMGRSIVIAFAIVGGVLVLVAILCVIAITFLGRQTSREITAVGPGNAYPAEVRRQFLTSCSVEIQQSICVCILDDMEDEYSLTELEQFLTSPSRRDGQLPSRLEPIIERCRLGIDGD